MSAEAITETCTCAECVSPESVNRTAHLEQSARTTTIIDKVEVAVRKGVRATWTELVGTWDEFKKTNVWQLGLIGLVAVLLVVSGFVEVFVDGILG